VRTNVVGLAGALQTLLTADANALASATRLVQRERKLSGAAWVQTLVFGWGHQPDASLEELAEHAGLLGVAITPQGLDRWFVPEAADCLSQLAQRAVAILVQTRPVVLPLLDRFAGVYVEDCTAVGLPADLAAQYPGCGGSDPAGAGQATLKTYVRLELRGGRVTDLAFQGGRHQDVVAGQQAPRLPAGSLRLKDLGFFDTAEMGRDTTAGVHWISRLPCSVVVQVGAAPAQPLAAWLRAQTADRVDVAATVGTLHPLPCRLIAVRCPEDVRQRRLRRLEERARRKGFTVSARQRVLCGWTVLVTNLPAERLTVDEAWVLYRARWQVELLFKLWKSHGRLDRSRGQRGDRVLCEVLAKLVAMLVQHWVVLTACPWLDGVAAHRKVRVVRRYLEGVTSALDDPEELGRVVAQIQRRLRALRPRSRRRSKPLTLDLLKDASKAMFGLS
jgi:Transposase DDE domain